jgi:hypothetical protein
VCCLDLSLSGRSLSHAGDAINQSTNATDVESSSPSVPPCRVRLLMDAREVHKYSCSKSVHFHRGAMVTANTISVNPVGQVIPDVHQTAGSFCGFRQAFRPCVLLPRTFRAFYLHVLGRYLRVQ